MKNFNWSSVHSYTLAGFSAMSVLMVFQLYLGLKFNHFDQLIFIISVIILIMTTGLGLSKYFIWYARNYESDKEDLEALK